jgi:hypothetical protein
MAEGMFRQATENLSMRYIPQPSSPASFVPSEEYRTIYPLLEIWGRDGDSQEVKEKVEYIYGRLKEDESSSPAHNLISLLTDLGAVPFGDSKIDKVYRFFRLHKEASRLQSYFEKLVSHQTPQSLSAAKKIQKYQKVLTKELLSARAKGARR